MVAYDEVEIPEPKIARFVFADTRFSWVWLVLRVYLGLQWLFAGWTKITSSAWIGPHAGVALHSWIESALATNGIAQPGLSGWYASFLQYVVLPNSFAFSYFVMYGEFLIGIALIVGAFTGITAALSSFLSLNYLFGMVAADPVLFVMEIILMLAWRNAGFLGLDRWFLPAFGVPGHPGTLFKQQQPKTA